MWCIHWFAAWSWPARCCCYPGCHGVAASSCCSQSVVLVAVVCRCWYRLWMMISVVCSCWFRWCTRWSAVCSCWSQSHIRWFVVCRCRFSWKWILGYLVVAGWLVSCCRFQLEVSAVAACMNCFHLRTQWFAAYNCWSRWCTRWVAVSGTIFKRNLPHSSYFWGHWVRSAGWCIAACSCWSRWCRR